MNTLQVLISYMRIKKALCFVAVTSAVMFTSGCGAITDVQLPDGVIGPATYNNREGAVRLTLATRAAASTTVAGYILSSGLLTDELILSRPPTSAEIIISSDKRSGHWASNPPHNIRALARLTRGIIGKYVPGENSGWNATLFMYEAYAEILTAEGWCSGVPLSTLEFEGDWTYKAGSSTDEIYAHAIQLLDSAAERATDSVSLQSVIRILKARAQLGLGLYGDAKQSVQGIDDQFRYDMRIAFDQGANRRVGIPKYENVFVRGATVSDNEGINGLSFSSSGDPRTRVALITGVGVNARKSFFASKYITTSDSSVFILTSGLEAQLILAEAAFHEENAAQMLTILNALRTAATYTVDTTELVGGGERIDTLWNAGAGGVAGLRPLQLPATPAEQRQLLFAERAAWLFLTGSRQGDLKRLVRKYGINRDEVYPVGVYSVTDLNSGSTASYGAYGTDISFGISGDEQRINSNYKGCNYDD